MEVWKWLVGAATAAALATAGWLWTITDPNAPTTETQVEETQPDGSKWTGDLIRDKLDPTKEQP